MTMKLGVLFLNLGGPRNLGEVEPFLFRLFSDPDTLPVPFSKWLQKPVAKLISKGRLKKSQGYYRAIGGGSPLLDITQKQAEGVRQDLSKTYSDVSVYTAMRYGWPSSDEVWPKICKDQITDVVVLPLYPQYSMATTGSSFEDLKRAMGSPKIRVYWVGEWYSHPLYIEAFADLIQQSIDALPASSKTNFDLVFSAHSLPLKFIQKGDPYEVQIKATARLLLEKLNGVQNWHLSYQSKTGPIRWLEPSTS